MSKRPLVSFSWEEGRYLDAWSLVHILSGASLGAGLLLLPIPMLWAFVIGVTLLVLWELFEMYIGIGESVHNLFADIIIGAVGFALAVQFLPSDRGDHILYFITLFAVNTFLAFAGWRAFVSRTGNPISKSVRKKHKEVRKNYGNRFDKLKK